MANGTLRYDPRTRKVQFTGSIRISDIQLEKLPVDVRALLEKPPHEATVDAQGLPPVFHLAAGGASRPLPTVAQRVDYVITSTSPKLVLNPPMQKPPTFQVTDPGLGYSVGNGFIEPERGLHPGLQLVQFGSGVPEIGGQSPDVNRNPYNFVGFCGSEPWLEAHPHPDHSAWGAKHHGVLEFKATTLTPFFIPEGFPFKAGEKEEESRFLRIERHFFRLPDADGRVRYAIPGSSLKGVLRSAVEALSNSRCGELNEGFYEQRIPYRRRVFDNAGILTKSAKAQWEVIPVELIYVSRGQWPGFRPPAPGKPLGYNIWKDRHKNFAVPGNENTATEADVLPFRANLLYAPNRHNYSHVITRRFDRRITFADGVVDHYERNLEHPHYESHRRKHGSEKDRYVQPLDERLPLTEGDVVFFTVNQAKRIDSFGKNVNYLWPARHSVKDLVEKFFPKHDLSLEDSLSMSERIFGFSGRHKKNEQGDIVSHPYRGKIRIETSWGPEAVTYAEEAVSPCHVKLRLAPLTAPATRAKSRPLYLEGKPDGTSATYDDAKPVLKGRKFYWHQRVDSATGLWAKHLHDPSQHGDVDGQCPPPFHALRANVSFTGRIHFDNLTDAELGCLLYALEGYGDHALKVGKGKPRGLGSLRFEVTTVRTIDPVKYYESLHAVPEMSPEKSQLIQSFRDWVSLRSKDSRHLIDFDRLHRLPARDSVRYYPINFSDFGWLPKPNTNPDKPSSGTYPRALARARDLEVD